MKIDAALAAKTRIHLRQKRCGYHNDIDPAQPSRREKRTHIGNGTTPNHHQQRSTMKTSILQSRPVSG
jgi:hypothetical protein